MRRGAWAVLARSARCDAAQAPTLSADWYRAIPVGRASLTHEGAPMALAARRQLERVSIRSPPQQRAGLAQMRGGEALHGQAFRGEMTRQTYLATLTIAVTGCVVRE